MNPYRLLFLPLILTLAGCPSDQEFEADQPELGRDNPRQIPPSAHTDVLVQTTPPVVDVLFVVDNSGSMQPYQDQLSENFPVFLDYFLGSGIDYHIGVVSTDMANPGQSGRLRSAAGVRWIDDVTPNPEGVFTAMVQLGTNGASTEQGIAAAYSCLELHADGYNEGFRRDEASLVVVAISDEQDQSGNNPVSPGEFAAYLESFREPGVDVSFSSIVTLAGMYAGSRYIGVTQAVGGIVWDIGSEDWEPVLDQLGFDALGLTRRFHLSQLPVESTIAVEVVTDGVHRVLERDSDWVYDPVENAVVFHVFVPEPLSQVVITYDLLEAQQLAPAL